MDDNKSEDRAAKESKSNRNDARHLSFFQRIFGEDMGEMIQVWFGILVFLILPMIVLLGGFNIIVYLANSLETHDESTAEISIEDLPPTDIIRYYVELDRELDKKCKELRKAIVDSEHILDNYSNEANELLEKRDNSYLSKTQLELLNRFASADSHADLSIKQWFRQRYVWYNIVSNVIVSTVFFILGILFYRRRTSMH